MNNNIINIEENNEKKRLKKSYNIIMKQGNVNLITLH